MAANNLISGIIWDPGHLISVRRKLVVGMIDRLVRGRQGAAPMLLLKLPIVEERLY